MPGKNPINRERSPSARRNDLLAICFAMAVPTLVTLVYFQWLKDAESSYQQIAFAIGKTIQFGFPIAWVWVWHRSRLEKSSSPPVAGKDLVLGVGFGMLVVASMYAIYFLGLANSEIAIQLTAMVKEKVSGMGVDTFWKYVALGVGYALVHSFMEEYYWRWFVYDMLKGIVRPAVANVVSSLGFMAHHVILLGFFFNWQWMTYPLSLCIAIGGMFWAWQYQTTGRLRIPWVSHMIVDAGIFSLGYFLVRGIL